MALCRVRTMARGTSSRTVTRRRRKKSSRCSMSLSTGSNSLAGDPGAAVTTWQAAAHAVGAARLRMASKRFTRHPFLEHFVDVPVLQITDEVHAVVMGSGEGGEGRGEAKVGVQLCSRCSSLALQGVLRFSAEDGGTQALAVRRWGGGFPCRVRGLSHR